MKTKAENNIERRYITHEVRAKADGDQGSEDVNGTQIEGVASVYENLYDMGWYLERVSSGALADADIADCKCLFNHDVNVVLGAVSSETLSISEADGINYQASLPDTTAAQDVFTLIKRGDINKSSFSFSVRESLWETVDRATLKDQVSEEILDRIAYHGKVDIRTIKSIKKLYDVSPVTYPANPDTAVAKRSHDAYIVENKPEQSVKRALNYYDARHKFNLNKSK